jgi:hypothetical protein
VCVCVFECVREPDQCVVDIFGAGVCERETETETERARVRVRISVCVSYVQARELEPNERVRMIVGAVQICFCKFFLHVNCHNSLIVGMTSPCDTQPTKWDQDTHTHTHTHTHVCGMPLSVFTRLRVYAQGT